MNLCLHGDSTLAVEVTHVSSHGIWLLTRNKEYFLPFEDFPWFAEAPIKAVLHVVEETPGHFHWPQIDVDLTEEMIAHPRRFPLISTPSG